MTLQFRAEIFNLLNRANFNTPNLIVFTSGLRHVSGTAGAISSTSTTSRQIQFALETDLVGNCLSFGASRDVRSRRPDRGPSRPTVQGKPPA